MSSSFLIGSLGCSSSSSSSSAGNGADDFRCATIAQPQSRATIQPRATPFHSLEGGPLQPGRWVLRSAELLMASDEDRKTQHLHSQEIGFALELAEDGMLTAVSVSTNGSVRRESGTYSTDGASLSYTSACRPSPARDGVAVDLGFEANIDYEVTGDTLVAWMHVKEARANGSSWIPVEVVLERESN